MLKIGNGRLRENPLDFLMLDLRETFEFTPIADAGTQDYERASYTIEDPPTDTRIEH